MFYIFTRTKKNKKKKTGNNTNKQIDLQKKRKVWTVENEEIERNKS